MLMVHIHDVMSIIYILYFKTVYSKINFND